MYLNSGAAAEQTTFTANDAAKMEYENDLLINNTIGIPYDNLAAATVKLNNLNKRLTNPADKERLNEQINKNNVQMAKIQAAMAGGARNRKRKDKHSRSKRRRLLKKAKRHTKTRRTRR
jgi:hypothetical protein